MIRHRPHLFELMRDQEHGLALIAQPSQIPEQVAGFLGREHRGRFVQNKDIRLAIKQLENLNSLLDADRKLLD